LNVSHSLPPATNRDRLLNILLIEDDEVDVLNVKRAFRKNQIQHSIYTASNGLEALDMLRGTGGQPPSLPVTRRLILLDINMPKMNGLEFLQVLRTDSQLQMIPVVVLTTSNQEQDRLQAYQLQVAGYLLKPITFAAFSHLITTFNHYWSACELP
jgi:CheY-like chemotaxis protein